jgi:hypothetical protein
MKLKIIGESYIMTPINNCVSQYSWYIVPNIFLNSELMTYHTLTLILSEELWHSLKQEENYEYLEK